MLISVLKGQISYLRMMLQYWSSAFSVEMVYVLFFHYKRFPQYPVSVV